MQGGEERVKARVSSTSRGHTDATVGSGSDVGASTELGGMTGVPRDAQSIPEDPGGSTRGRNDSDDEVLKLAEGTQKRMVSRLPEWIPRLPD